MTSDDLVATVTKLLRLAGLTPSDEEAAALAAAFNDQQRRIDAMWAVPETRYEAPAVVFDPDPSFANWWED